MFRLTRIASHGFNRDHISGGLKRARSNSIDKEKSDLHAVSLVTFSFSNGLSIMTHDANKVLRTLIFNKINIVLIIKVMAQEELDPGNYLEPIPIEVVFDNSNKFSPGIDNCCGGWPYQEEI